MATELTFAERAVVPDRGLSEVFDYVTDFPCAAEWRVEVVDSSMSPPPRCGSIPESARRPGSPGGRW